MSSDAKSSLAVGDAVARSNPSLFAEIESDVAIRICHQLPTAVTPDHLTGLGLVGALVAGGGYLMMPINANYAWLATLGILLNWIGDSLDGNLARVRKAERPRFGFFIDHSVDALSTFAVMVGLSLSGMVNPIVGLVVLATHNLMVSYVFINHAVSRVLVIAHSRIGPTEIRILLMVANTLFVLAAVFMPDSLGAMRNVMNVLFATWGLGSFATFISSVTRTALRLRRELGTR